MTLQSGSGSYGEAEKEKKSREDKQGPALA